MRSMLYQRSHQLNYPPQFVLFHHPDTFSRTPCVIIALTRQERKRNSKAAGENSYDNNDASRKTLKVRWWCIAVDLAVTDLSLRYYNGDWWPVSNSAHTFANCFCKGEPFSRPLCSLRRQIREYKSPVREEDLRSKKLQRM
jgi:hypothetical protein